MDFSNKYKRKGLFWGSEPDNIIIKLTHFITNGTVLDIGVGEGKNALYLAKKGFDVYGIDISNIGLEKIKKLSLLNNIAIKTKCIDILNYSFKEKFDVMVSTYTLHFLKKKEYIDIIQKIKKYTNIGGFNVLAVFTKETPDYSQKKELKYNLCLFKKNELKKYYKDWNIIEYSEKLVLDKSHDKPHYHFVASIIAKKE